VSARVSPTERIGEEIDALFTGDRDLVEVLEDVARLGARLIIQTALEAEVTEFLGRARYQRAASAEDARPGSRNGYCETTVKTTAGPVRVARPKLRGATEAFASRLFGTGVTKTNALESLVIAGFVRGLSVRDVEATLADALGAEAALSKSTVSRVCEQVKDEFTRWRERRLDDLVLDYLFLDASHFKMHPGARAEPVLAAWGITTEGKPVFVALGEGGSESTDAWSDFLGELTARGLTPPLLVISDGAGGLINATETVLGRSLRQRCLIHRSRKESSCRCVAAGCSGSEEFGSGAVTDGRWGWDAAVLFQEGSGCADGVADGGAADVAERVGEDVEGAQLPEMQDGQQDTFAVADLLGEDAAAGAGLAGAAAALVGAPLGVGGLSGREALGELMQLLPAHAGEGRVGQGMDDRGPGGAEVLVEEGEQVVGGGEPH
jgi:putative transposase